MPTWIQMVMDVMDLDFKCFSVQHHGVWAIMPPAEAMHLGHLLPFMFTQCLGHATEVAQHVEERTALFGVMQVQLQPSHD